jgi:hypothetical protein
LRFAQVQTDKENLLTNKNRQREKAQKNPGANTSIKKATNPYAYAGRGDARW